MTSEILDRVAQRIPTESSRTQRVHREMIDGMRQEINPVHYAAAQAWLKKQETAIAETYQPFLTRLLALQAQAKTPLPWGLKNWFKELSDLCVVGPQQLRDGLKGYDTLVPPLQPNGTVDLNLRASWIFGIRVSLLSGEGVLNCLAMLKTYCENYLQERPWPSPTQEGD